MNRDRMDWFHGHISRATAEQMMQDLVSGAFLVRSSESRPGFTLSQKTAGCVLHFMIKCEEQVDQSGRRDVHWILVGKEGIYPDLPSLVAHFTALAATDNNAAEAIVLVETPAFAEGRTKVIPAATAEEEDDYHQAGTTFDQCKICYDGMKDTQVNPCGHLLCSECAKTVAALETALNAQPKCPFCRVSITSLGWVKIEQKPAELPAEVATGGGGGAAAAAAPTKFAPDYFHGAVPNSAAIGRATAQYDYTPVADAEIPIKKGDVIFIFATEAQY
eukprot:gene18859-3480_t